MEQLSVISSESFRTELLRWNKGYKYRDIHLPGRPLTRKIPLPFPPPTHTRIYLRICQSIPLHHLSTLTEKQNKKLPPPTFPHIRSLPLPTHLWTFPPSPSHLTALKSSSSPLPAQATLMNFLRCTMPLHLSAPRSHLFHLKFNPLKCNLISPCYASMPMVFRDKYFFSVSSSYPPKVQTAKKGYAIVNILLIRVDFTKCQRQFFAVYFFSKFEFVIMAEFVFVPLIPSSETSCNSITITLMGTWSFLGREILHFLCLRFRHVWFFSFLLIFLFLLKHEISGKRISYI